MLGRKRRSKVPAELKAKLGRDERVIASASTVDATGTVVVTTFGLWLPERERLGWHQIHKATWAGNKLTVIPALAVSEHDGYTVMADDEPVVVALTEPEDVPSEVRQRVTRSVAHTEHHPVPGGGVRVVGRRVPGVNGLTWHVRYDEGTDTEDPQITAFASELVAEAARPRPE